MALTKRGYFKKDLKQSWFNKSTEHCKGERALHIVEGVQLRGLNISARSIVLGHMVQAVRPGYITEINLTWEKSVKEQGKRRPIMGGGTGTCKKQPHYNGYRNW